MKRFTIALIILGFAITTCESFLHQHSHATNPRRGRYNPFGVAIRRTTSSSASTALYSLPTAIEARDFLLETAERLKKIDGVLLVDTTSKKALQNAVKELEAVCRPPSKEEIDDTFVGDWTLLCSTATNQAGFDTSKIPLPGPLKNISDLLKRSLVVKQLIRDMDGDGKVDRIDHVLQYQPPDTLREVLDNLPEGLKALNINPLHVTEGKLTLKHKAEMEAFGPVPRTKLSLESIIFSLAGQSQYLDGSGADVLGINLPFGEFLNSGTFETTYMDDEIRISRGKLGVVDQLRVFVRSEVQEEIDAFEEADETPVEADVVGKTPEDLKETEEEDEKEDAKEEEVEEETGPSEESGDI